MQGLLGEAVRLHQAGMLDQAALLYRKALASDPHNPDALHLLGMIALQRNRPRDAVELISRALAGRDGDASYHFHLACAFQALDDMEQAVAGYRRALALNADDPGIHNNLGNALAAQGNLEEARLALQRALALSPGSAGTHNNLGNVQRSLGLGAEAEASFRKALALDPNLVSALINLGETQWNKGAMAEAEALYARALARQSDDAGLLETLAALHLMRGDGAGAMSLIRRSLAIRESANAKKLFVRAAARPGDLDGAIRPLLVRALNEAWDRPALLAPAAARLIRSGASPLSLDGQPGEAGFASLADDALLQALLVNTPNMDLALEERLVALRGALLREMPAGMHAECFAATLAQQCFINEYVFPLDESERGVASALRTEAESGTEVTPLQLLVTACYFPLHGLANAAALLERSWPAHIDAVLTQQIREPMAERRLRAQIPRLSPIDDTVSKRVQAQYEENPYPRWVRAVPGVPVTIGNFLKAKFPLARFEPLSANTPPDILIAGCGTGQRSIAMAQKFGDRSLLAVDLSLASLGYARRKAEELGLRIIHAQADILELEGGRFDLIESLGVLHHLADPFAGWRKLVSLLRPGGVMLTGLYSERARRPIVEARSRIAAQGLGSGADDIRRFRQLLIREGGAAASILQSEDFFSLSACRDLLFHVQEKRLTLPRIAAFLAEQRLTLLGFELDEAVLAAYRQRFPQDKAATDLACWDTFEAEHPGLFGGMYIFWVQKAAASAPGV